MDPVLNALYKSVRLARFTPLVCRCGKLRLEELENMLGTHGLWQQGWDLNPGLPEFRNLFQMCPPIVIFPILSPFYGTFTIINSNLLLRRVILRDFKI